jgi:dTDP-glucose pyrophosphorylase
LKFLRTKGQSTKYTGRKDAWQYVGKAQDVRNVHKNVHMARKTRKAQKAQKSTESAKSTISAECVKYAECPILLQDKERAKRAQYAINDNPCIFSV